MIEYLAYHGLDGYRRELVFAPPRMWRFDFAFEMDRFAVEVEGILWLGDSGRHQRAKGFEDDAEKYEAAMLLGWIVYRVPSTWIAKGDRRIWRPEVATTIRTLTPFTTGGNDAGTEKPR